MVNIFLCSYFAEVASKINEVVDFQGKDIGYAIQINSFHPYPTPKLLEDVYPGITPPQSFCYVED